MTDKKKTKRRKQSKNASSTPVIRRIGALLTLLVVCVVVVAAGYVVGRYVIQGVISDTLGETPGAVTVQQRSETSVTQEEQTSGHNIAGLPVVGRSDKSDTGQALGHDENSSGAGQLTSQTTQPNEGALSPGAQQSEPTRPASSTVSPSLQPSPTTGGSSSSQGAAGTAPTGSSAAGTPVQSASSSVRVFHRVQVGAFGDFASAERLLDRLVGDYPDAFITQGNQFRVQVGSFSSEEGATEVVEKLQSAGHEDVRIVSVTIE